MTDAAPSHIRRFSVQPQSALFSDTGECCYWSAVEPELARLTAEAAGLRGERAQLIELAKDMRHEIQKARVMLRDSEVDCPRLLASLAGSVKQCDEALGIASAAGGAREGASDV